MAELLRVLPYFLVLNELQAERRAKLEDKVGKLHEKELALTRLTRDLEKAGSVIQPFRNNKLDFEPPRISGKVPLFGTDKWIESQNE